MHQRLFGLLLAVFRQQGEDRDPQRRRAEAHDGLFADQPREGQRENDIFHRVTAEVLFHPVHVGIEPVAVELEHVHVEDERFEHRVDGGQRDRPEEEL